MIYTSYNNKAYKISILLLIVSLFFSCLTPQYLVEKDAEKKSASTSRGSGNEIIFFDEDVSPEGGYSYAYPEPQSSVIVDETGAKDGMFLLRISLDSKSWSGVGIGRSPLDLSPLRNKGTLTFFIKGETGKETGISVCFIDSPAGGGGFHSDLVLSKYCTISKNWQEIVIPLADFSDSATFWDEASQQNKNGKLDWKDIIEVSFYNGPMSYDGNITFYVDAMKIIPETRISDKAAEVEAQMKKITSDTNFAPEKLICGKRVIVYHPHWVANFRAGDIPYDKVTHIGHAFVIPTPDGELSIPGAFIEKELIINARKNGVKVMVALGGASEEASDNFSKVAASKELREKFADNLEKFCRENGYDGIDLDWEFPKTEKDTKNEVLLVKAIYDKFKSSPAPAPKWLISKACAGGQWFGKWSDYDNLNQYMDFYNFMSYDYHGEWNDHSGHNAPLFGGLDLEEPEASCEGGLDYMTKERKVPAEMINLGLAFFGHKFLNSTGLMGPCDGGKCKAEGLNYFIIHELLKDKSWVEKWDDDSKNPYLQAASGQGVIYYDNERSLRAKVKWAYQQKLGGVFVWDISADFVDGENKLMPGVYDEAAKQCKSE